MKNRGSDFADCFKGDVGLGLGVDAQIMATDYIGTGVGASSVYKTGFKGRYNGSWEDYHVGFGIVDYGDFGWDIQPAETENQPPAKTKIRSFCGINPSWSDEPKLAFPKKPFLDKFDIEAGGTWLVAGFRVGFSPGQLLDFIIGWTGIDIADDDKKLKK